MKSISNMMVPCEEPCPNCAAAESVEKFISTAPVIVDPMIAGRVRLNSDISYRLKQIKKHHTDKAGVAATTTSDAFNDILDKS